MIYADTSFIASAYLADVNTAAAKAFLSREKPRLAACFLHWPEMAKVAFLNSAEAVWDSFKSDVYRSSKFFRPDLDAERVALRAAALLRHNVRRWPSLRSLDAMHVAAAVESGCRHFLSFDSASCQRILAHDQGLNVWPDLSADEKERIKTPARRVAPRSAGSN